MSNKTTKTPKKNLSAIEWPTAHFTINDVGQKYPDIINITLRFRVKKALEAHDIVTIGKIKPAIGRPRLVFAKANPTKEILEAATASGVLPFEDAGTKAVKTVIPVAAIPATPVAAAVTVVKS